VKKERLKTVCQRCLLFLLPLVIGSLPQAAPGNEWSRGFRLEILELAFTNGKSYRVVPSKSPGPAYYATLKASGQGVLKGKWLVDDQIIGLFEVFLQDGAVVDLGGKRVPRLPMDDTGPHELTIAFTNYDFPKSIPIIRYYVVEGGAILIRSPEPGSAVRVSKTGQTPLQLQWEWDNAGRKKTPVYQVLVSETPLQFLTGEKMADMWKTVGPQNTYTLDAPPYRRKKKKWLYWQVRALAPSGQPVTFSEFSSFKLLYLKE
jgi:hypothetical protein